MPFEVTATRKRPQTFEQLAGQNFVAATLISSLEQGRIAHAYLFSGPRGCGKTSTARILAKALNCERGPSATPCGTCPSCAAISSGNSLDVIEIDGASNTSVDNIRQIKDEVLFAPNSARYKIYIIDEVHMLSLSAFNALLKTIEEPPPYIVFIFATTEPHKVPATIKSRCQQFNFRLVPVETILKLLRQAAEETGIQAEEEALLWIAREAAGSVRDAYTLFDQIASFSGHIITAQNIRETLGLVGIDQLNSMFRALAQGAAKEAFDVLDGIFARGVSPEQFLTDAVDYCRSALLLSYGVRKEGLLSSPRSSFEPSVLESLSNQKLEYAISVLLDTYRHLKETVDSRYEVELAIAKLSHIDSYISPSELFNAVRSLRETKVALSSGSTSPVSEPKHLPSEGAAPIPFQNRAKDEVPRSAPLLRDLSSRLAQNHLNDQESFAPKKAQSDNSEVATGDNIEKAETAAPPNSLQPVALSDLRKKIISKLRGQNLFLASALEKSGEWLPKHNGYIIPVLNRVEMDLISRFSSLIAETGASILGAPCAIEVHSAKSLEQTASRQNAHQLTATTPTQPSISAREPADVATTSPNAKLAAPEVATPSPTASLSSEHTWEPEATNIERSVAIPSQKGTSHSTEEEHHPSEPSDPSANIPKEDELIVEAIRKLFKGKIVASTPATSSTVVTAPSGLPSDVPEPSAPVAPSAFSVPDSTEDSEEYFNTEEEYD